MRIFWSLITTGLFIAILSGCRTAPEQEIVASPTKTLVPTKTHTPHPTHTPPPSATPTQTITSTPDIGSVLTATPGNSVLYESPYLDFPIRHAAGWTVTEDDGSFLLIEEGDRYIYIDVFPAEVQADYDDNPILALQSFISFASLNMPDKEKLHLTVVNDSVFAFGSYKHPEEAEGFSNLNPLFIAMLFAENHTIIIEFHAPQGNEEENREIFDILLASLPESVVDLESIVAAATLAPAASLNLPELPQGYAWQGVDMIDFALPVPKGWFVSSSVLSEMWFQGLQAYHYQYLVTPENMNLTGIFSGGLVVRVIKDDGVSAADQAEDFYSGLKVSPNTTRVFESWDEESGGRAIYRMRYITIDPDLDPQDPRYETAVYFVAIANKATDVLYLIFFESSVEAWDQEWADHGEVMVGLLVELLE